MGAMAINQKILIHNIIKKVTFWDSKIRTKIYPIWAPIIQREVRRPTENAINDVRRLVSDQIEFSRKL